MEFTSQSEGEVSRIRILHVTATTTGGVGQVILDLCRLHDENRFDIAVTTGRGYWLDRKFIESGVELIPLPMSRQVRFIEVARSLRLLYRMLRKERYDIVHTHTSIGGFVGRLAAKAAGVPVVIFHIHGLASHPFQHRLKRGFYWMAEKLLDRVTDHYIAVSADYQRMAVESRLCSPNKVSKIINGISFPSSQGQGNDQERRRLRAELALDADDLIVGTVTRLERQKAIPVLLKSFRDLLRSVPAARLLIVGGGPLRTEMEVMANDFNIKEKLRFLGWREDIAELLRIFDVFVLSSRWEGCPIALLEAMSQGIPVAVTAAVGVREIIEPEVNGLMVPTNDSVGLARATSRILQDPGLARTLGDNAKRSVFVRYTAEQMTARHEALYLKLLGKQ